MNILRKSLVMLTFALVSISAMAEQFCYLTFETKDGAKVSVAIESLTMTISGTTLVAGNQTFVLDNLSKMYFSVSDETTTTGIRQLENMDAKEILAIYDLQGHLVSENQLKKGVYIVKTKDGTFKIASR